MVRRGMTKGTPSKQHSATHRSRGRQERFLRFVLRRKLCIYFLITNIIIFMLMGVLISTAHMYISNLKIEREFLYHENQIFEKMYKNSTLYLHCVFEKGNDEAMKDWSFDLCRDYCGPEAMSYRHRRVNWSTQFDFVCIDHMDRVPCSTANITCGYDFKQVPPDTMAYCPGVRGLVTDAFRLPMDNPSRRLPAVTADKLKVGEIWHVAGLLQQCPKCRAVTENFYVEDEDIKTDNCYRVIVTDQEGYPMYNRLCDSIEIIKPKVRKEDECERIKLFTDNDARVGKRDVPARRNSDIHSLIWNTPGALAYLRRRRRDHDVQSAAPVEQLN